MKYLWVFIFALCFLAVTRPAKAQILRRVVPTSTPIPVRLNVPLQIAPSSTSTPVPTRINIPLRIALTTTPTTTQRQQIFQISPTSMPPINIEPIISTRSTLTSIASTAARLSVGEITDTETATQEGKLVYTLRVKEKLKLFGFIPITTNTIFEIDGDTKNLRKTNRPWWSFLASKPDWTMVFQQLGPNLTIKDVIWDKKSYHVGDTATLSFKIANTGTEGVWQSDPITNVWRMGEKAIYTDIRSIFINPGGEWTFNYFKWDSFQCNQPVSLEIDLTGKVKETDKKDNIWKGVSICAPVTGPDLVVSQLKLENAGYSPEKFVGINNTVKYSISNIGILPSTPVRALMKAGSGQYLSLIDIPVLIPFIGNFTGEVKYTPTNCDPVELNIDTENKLTEINRDNNLAYEPAEVTDHCKRGADITIDNVYWKSSAGYSFGKPAKNGDWLNFEVTLANTSMDNSWGCVHQVQLGVYENGQLINTITYGDLGPSPKCSGGGISGTSDHPKIVKTQKFNFTAGCGSTLRLVVDPNNNFSETDKSNNSWSQTINCE